MPVHRGIATFTLDRGKCPPWLFERMVDLGGEMIQVLVEEYGPEVFIRRIADPVWFQSLGTVLAFDWNASGLTTILTAALKEAIREREEELGLFICGGKGRQSLKTPDELNKWGEKLALADGQTESLIYNSRMSAKVDSSLVQDGFQIYHHTLFFTKSGTWSVVQQGMNTEQGSARRYHWHSDTIRDLIVEPHAGIISQSLSRDNRVLNLTASESESSRNLSLELAQSGQGTLMKDLKLLDNYTTKDSKMARVRSQYGEQLTLLELRDHEFHTHPVLNETFSDSPYLKKIFRKINDVQPRDYERLLAMEGVGPKTLRALALVSEVIYGASNSYRDPARYSFAHGGKDGTPYPVKRSVYDESIRMLRQAVRKSNIGPYQKERAVERLRGREESGYRQ